MINWIRKIRIGFLHARYHRILRKADQARTIQNVVEFKKYIYQAEDVWRRIVVLTEKMK
jgi:hypothetical protein